MRELQEDSIKNRVRIGEPLPQWSSGVLDLHHINTGWGDCAFYRLPDGTSMLVDAGEMDSRSERFGSVRNAPIRPDAGRPGHEWIADYIAHVYKETAIDYAWVTHFHSDHLGCVTPSSPPSASGLYARTGVTGVGDLIRFSRIVDRGYPDYGYPVGLEDPLLVSAAERRPNLRNHIDTMRNYQRFIAHHRESGMVAEQFRVGSADQFVLRREPDRFPSFRIRNVAGNGCVWSGVADEARSVIPPIADLPRESYPSENLLSCGITLQYGRFTMYNGADIPGRAGIGAPQWTDIETHVAPVVGQVDVMVMNHHGYRDTHNRFFVSTLRPRVIVQQNWSADQPGAEVLERLLSRELYPGDRDLFATALLDVTRTVIGPDVDRGYRSTSGHIVIRVNPGGDAYTVIILDDRSADRLVTAVHGPYASR